MRKPDPCKHKSSRTITVHDMTHRICNACGMALESPQLRESFVKVYTPTIGEILAAQREAKIAERVLGAAPCG